jgi:hypothetical protein
MPAFQNTLSVPVSWAYEDGTECSEMLACKIQMLGNYPEESIQQFNPISTLTNHLSEALYSTILPSGLFYRSFRNKILQPLFRVL